MPRYRVTITSPDRQLMLDLVRKRNIQVLDHGVRKNNGEYSVDALVEDAEVQTLQAEQYRVRKHEDADERGKQRQSEVGAGNRYIKPK